MWCQHEGVLICWAFNLLFITKRELVFVENVGKIVQLVIIVPFAL